MNTEMLYEWQILDSANGLIMPWWTHPFLEELKSWNLSDKTWLEFGAGRSTAWLRSRCKWVDSIEANSEWATQAAKDCGSHSLTNGTISYKDLPDGIQERKQEYFDLIPKDKVYDIISVDGIWRYECLQWAINHFKGRSGTLIADNWNQAFVWISPPALELMKPYDIHVFEQKNHTDNDGVNKWKTVYWELNGFNNPSEFIYFIPNGDETKD